MQPLKIVTFGALALTIVTATTPDLSPSLQNILANTNGNPLYTYPTDLTRGIVPKGIHSHNDYWRDLPFYTALSAGCISIEADVWLLNGTLYIGHEPSSLTPSRTFASLYIEPILSVLRRENPSTPFVTTGPPTKNGVFDAYSTQTLYLWIDVKTAGATTWPYVVRALDPLRKAGYLTTANATALTYGPVTVIGTGNTPLAQIQNVNVSSGRDYFYDAPIPLLNASFANITSLVSPIASTDLEVQFGVVNGTALDATQLARLREQVRVAHGKGIKVRYWDLPAWPVATRNAVWRILRDEGVDLINVDDVYAAAGLSDEAGYW